MDKTLGGAFSGKTRRVLFYCMGCQKITTNFVQFDG
nr:MAG TPA: phosphoenolpyruvate carboxykinase [Caudoviricetes sp.]